MLKSPSEPQYAQRSPAPTTDTKPTAQTDVHASRYRLSPRSNKLGQAVGIVLFLADDLILAPAALAKASTRTAILRALRIST